MPTALSTTERCERERKAHGVDVVLRAEQSLAETGIICCVAGAKVLKYYGSRLIPDDWEICVPDDRAKEAAQLFVQRDGTYERGRQILPQLGSLLHTYPIFSPRDWPVKCSFFIVPASEWFPQGLDPAMIERTRNGVPVPSLRSLAQSLVDTQNWFLLDHLVDGMDLDEDWGLTNLRLGMPSPADVEFIRDRNRKIDSSCAAFPDCHPVHLNEASFDRTERWRKSVRGKRSRIDPYGNGLERYITRFRLKDSGDPRLRDVGYI